MWVFTDKMKKSDLAYFLALVIFAAFIWIRDLAWANSAEDVLQIDDKEAGKLMGKGINTLTIGSGINVKLLYTINRNITPFYKKTKL